MDTILDTLGTDGSFRTLLALLKLVGMSEKLNQPGPFTLFAPNDDAFKRINIDEISRDRGALTTLLQYHLLGGEYGSGEIADQRHLVTESGKSLSVSKNEGRPVIDNAQFVRADIRCGNGIIHVIDHVFLPEFSGWYCGGC